MKIRTEPHFENGASVVYISLNNERGGTKAELTPDQAEDIAKHLFRAASVARQETCLAKVMDRQGYLPNQIESAVLAQRSVMSELLIERG